MTVNENNKQDMEKMVEAELDDDMLDSVTGGYYSQDFRDKTCAEEGCNNMRVEGSMYCRRHTIMHSGTKKFV